MTDSMKNTSSPADMAQQISDPFFKLTMESGYSMMNKVNQHFVDSHLTDRLIIDLQKQALSDEINKRR